MSWQKECVAMLVWRDEVSSSDWASTTSYQVQGPDPLQSSWSPNIQ
jgi:hypothetical protein